MDRGGTHERIRREAGHQRFRRALRALGVPQNQLAAQLDITPEHLSRVKSGNAMLSHSLAAKLELTVGVSATWLLTGAGEMICDWTKAMRYIAPEDVAERPLESPAGAVLEYGAREGRARAMATADLARLLALRLYSPGLPRRSPVSDRWAPASLPLLDVLTADKPEMSDAFSGARIEVPYPWGDQLYCVRAGDRWTPEFRDAEFLVIERRPQEAWQVPEVDAQVCVVRLAGGKTLELAHVRPVEDSNTAKLTIVPIPAGSGEERMVAWDDIEVVGVLRMAFRTRFPALEG